MHEPHPLASKLLARVGAAGRDNIQPRAVSSRVLPFRFEHEGAAWVVFLHESLARSREGFQAMEDRFQRLAEGLSALVASLEAFADALRQELPPDDRGVDEPNATG